jgi:hypothetical protein
VHHGDGPEGIKENRGIDGEEEHSDEIWAKAIKFFLSLLPDFGSVCRSNLLSSSAGIILPIHQQQQLGILHLLQILIPARRRSNDQFAG